MYQMIRSYLERSEYARTPDQLRDAVSAIIAPIDFHSFAFLALGEPPFLISTYPIEWTGHYVAQGYQRRDPVILHSHRVRDLFMWGAAFAKRFGPGARDFFHEAEAFDISSGATIPIPDWPGGLAAMTFATDRRQPQLTTCLRCNGAALLFITAHFNGRLRQMLEPTRLIEGAVLTAREYELLRWAAEGKSSADTAQITGLSHRIVARDLESVRAKLGVRSIGKAIALFAAYEATRNRNTH